MVIVIVILDWSKRLALTRGENDTWKGLLDLSASIILTKLSNLQTFLVCIKSIYFEDLECQ